VKLENILLGVLLRHPSTGYDLKKYLDTAGRFHRSNTQMSQVYRTLGSMERLGWVVHETLPRPGARDAKRYRVTEEGATVFLDWIKGPYHSPSRLGDPEFTVRLSFAGFMSVEEVIALLEVEIRERREQVARYRFRDRALPVDPDLPYDEELADAVGEWQHRRGSVAMDAHIAECEDLRRRLLDGDLSFEEQEGETCAPSS
jgi:DNA-binding PadR family transcriptional regulator